MPTCTTRLLLLLTLAGCGTGGGKTLTDTDSTSDTDVAVTDTDVAADTDLPICESVPTCVDVGFLPSSPSFVDDPSAATTAGDTSGCAPATLLVALRGITVHAAKDDVMGDVIYCVIQVEAPNGPEIRVTTPSGALNEGDSHTFTLLDGTVWGDIDTPRIPGGDMTMTYDCLEVGTVDGRDLLVTAIANAATSANAVQNGSLWTFPAGASMDGIVSTAVTASGDDALFHAQASLPLAQQLAMTHGAAWSVRQSGVASLSDWDWAVDALVWGCSDNGS